MWLTYTLDIDIWMDSRLAVGLVSICVYNCISGTQ